MDSAVAGPRRQGRVTPARRRSLDATLRRLAVWYVLPGWVLVLLVFALPILGVVYLSFRNETLGGFSPAEFVGLANYHRELSSPRFWEAFRVTFIIMFLGLAIQLPLGLFLAMLLDRPLRGLRLFRSALIIPMLLTPVAVGLMWRFMFDTDLGIINWLLATVGVDGPIWLGARWPAIFAVVIVDSWQAIPFVMLMSLAALASLPHGPQEAARIDGANGWQVFFHVTLPMLSPVLLIILMIRVIDSFKLFDIIFILTQRGGPGTATQTLGMLTYNTGFIFFEISRAAALGVTLVVISFPIYFLWRYATRAVNA